MSTMNQHLLVRYLVKKHNPSIAETLFVDDDTIWLPKGLFPLRGDESSSETRCRSPSAKLSIQANTPNVQASSTTTLVGTCPPQATTKRTSRLAYGLEVPQ